MAIIDLTLPVPCEEDGHPTLRTEQWHITTGRAPFDALVHWFHHGSMAGTYIDFPTHIRQTDDGSDAANYPPERLYRVEATVIRLDRADGSGAVHADELQRAAHLAAACGALILNALGARRFDEIEERSVWLAADAVQWIVAQGVHLLVSDVYESNADPQDVFLHLFRAGVATVCCPVNLHQLDAPRVRVTALPLRFPGATQIPCRLVAELE